VIVNQAWHRVGTIECNCVRAPRSKTFVKHRPYDRPTRDQKEDVPAKEHRTAARISVQTLAGDIRLRLPDRPVELPTGQLLVLDQCVPHDFEAEEDSAFSLTLT
jgi:hypothetical protein